MNLEPVSSYCERIISWLVWALSWTHLSSRLIHLSPYRTGAVVLVSSMVACVPIPVSVKPSGQGWVRGSGVLFRGRSYRGVWENWLYMGVEMNLIAADLGL